MSPDVSACVYLVSFAPPSWDVTPANLGSRLRKAHLVEEGEELGVGQRQVTTQLLELHALQPHTRQQCRLPAQ